MDKKQPDPLIIFTPSGRRGRFPENTTILNAARQLGVDLDSVCGGRGICGRCQVEPVFGDFQKHGIKSKPEHFSSFSKPEQRFKDMRGLNAGHRLGCHTRILGDSVVDVPVESQLHQQIIRKQAQLHPIDVNPVVQLYLVEVSKPVIHDPRGDLERLLEALDSEWGLTELNHVLPVLEVLQSVLRSGDWKVTVAVRDGGKIIAVWPGLKEKVFGVAVDVGSTTLSAHLCDLASGEVLNTAGLMNPQIRFGEDLMSRISYIQAHPGADKEMTVAVRVAICELINEVSREAGIIPDDIVEMTVVGNPVMHHLFLGINPIELGSAPFSLAFDSAVTLSCPQAELNINPGGHIYVLPCIAGHVGADAAGMILSERPQDSEKMTLLVDVGTNAEIVLGNNKSLLAASSPTGPAFEGAQISSGQRASPGAIERVRIDPTTLEPRFKIIGCELWSNEPGFVKAASTYGVTGICGSGIIEAIVEMLLAGIIHPDGHFSKKDEKKCSRLLNNGQSLAYTLFDPELEVAGLAALGQQAIRVLQADIRAIQLAKASLYAGIYLLMGRLQIEKVDRVRFAGAFGSHIDVKYAMALGLIPDCDLEQVSSAGNAAGTGARVALLDGNARGEIEALVRSIIKIETAIDKQFQQHFIEALAIPHQTHSFKNFADMTAP